MTFIKPTDIDKLGTLINDQTAAVIVEPVQGVAGAVDMPQDFLAALRFRCSENGSILIFDEVQCGVGRTGYPFAANMYGVTPDIITTAKALGAGFPVSAMLIADHVAPYLKIDTLGTTFGGGPMACAIVETVIDIIESENLLENVRAALAQIRRDCVVGPVVATQGAGLLLGLRTSRPAKDVQAELLKLDILTGTSSDPNVLRILAPFVLGSEHVEQLRAALRPLPRRSHHEPLSRPGRLPARAGQGSARSRRATAEHPQPQALAGKVLGLLFLNPSLRTLASFQSAMMRLGGAAVVITPGQGTWQMETRSGAIMNGAAAEHVREAVPVLASYCDAMGIACSPRGAISPPISPRPASA